MVAMNIKWDTDGEEVDLPSVVEIPQEVCNEAISDWLSDEYGFCHTGFELHNYNLTEKHLNNAKRCLADNGIDLDETGVVLQALLAILLDEDIDCEDGLTDYTVGDGCEW